MTVSSLFNLTGRLSLIASERLSLGLTTAALEVETRGWSVASRTGWRTASWRTRRRRT